MVAATQAYPLSQNPMKVVRNVSSYALWPTSHTPHGYMYLWACGHTGPMPHVCSKGPDRATLFEAPDLRLMRPGWFRAQRFMERVGISEEMTADEAKRIAQRRVGGRRVA